MSTETVILLELRALRAELERTNRHIDLLRSRIGARADRLRSSEAAAYLDCDRRTLYRWAEQGRLTHHGGPRPWAIDELDALLAGPSVDPIETRGRRRAPYPSEPANVRI